MKPKRVSIRDVAVLAGTSIGSASRVINNAENVTPEIREKVKRAISALGYRPNHAAQALRSRTSKTIGCLLSDVTNPLYARTFSELEARFFAAGYMLLLGNGLNEAQREVKILNTFHERGMDGVIIAPGNEQDPAVLEAIRNLNMPTVIYDRDIAPEADAVLYDHRQAISDALDYLFALGHTRIALILWQASSRAVRLRLEAYQAAFTARNLPVPDLSIQNPSATSSAFDSVMEILERRDRPTAIIAQGTQIVSSTLRAISVSGLRVPEDVSVIGIGDSDFAKNSNPPLTVLKTPIEEVAEHACNLLLERIQERNDGVVTEPIHKEFGLRLVKRDSCAPVADHSVATGVTGDPTAPGSRSGGAVNRNLARS